MITEYTALTGAGSVPNFSQDRGLILQIRFSDFYICCVYKSFLGFM